MHAYKKKLNKSNLHLLRNMTNIDYIYINIIVINEIL